MKLYFELENLEDAKRYYGIANEKSKFNGAKEGRVWKGEKDMKYYKLFKKK